MSISVLILTLNEEANLPACLASVAWSDDVVVLDSYSTDGTLAIARAAGARVFQRTFDGEHAQRTFGLTQIPFKHSWVYMPDADEITPPELTEEMLAIAADPNRPEAAFRVRFKTILMGKWLRYSSLYPTWVVRLVRPQKIRFEREINLRCLVDGPEGRLSNHFLHFSFNKGLDAWFEKHNRYSWHEAQETLKSLRADGLDWRGCWSIRDDVRRRRALKELSFRLPFRPTLRFLYMFVMRRGFLDGWPGYLYCRLLATYEQMIVVKTAELRRREKGLPV
jgi:glycosyltransferase involved in cell wall biosynthesis